MTEQKIEKMAIDRLEAALSAAGVEGVQTIGAWQSVTDDQIKALEDGRARGVLAVKVYPRQYETPTVPDGSMQVEVSLNVRAETDAQGSLWLKATEAVSDVLQKWQKSYQDYKPVFELSGEFLPTGFNIAGGDCGLDKQNDLWQYTQTFNLYGVIC